MKAARFIVIITQQLSKGTFSDVYVAEHLELAYERVWKVARTPSFRYEPNDTTSVAPGSAGLEDVVPDPDDLLQRQFAKLTAVSEFECIIRPQSITTRSGSNVLESTYIRQAMDLRQFMRRNPVSTRLLSATARQLDHLSLNSNFQFHGDLKPENLLVAGGQTMLIIDPGHFGPLRTRTGIRDCMVTTLKYYPFCKPDDMFAFGLVLWEIVFGLHPFDSPGAKRPATGALLQLLNEAGNARTFLEPLLRLPLPRELRVDLDPRIEDILLQCLGLRIDSSRRLDVGHKYVTFENLADDLQQLADSGVLHLSRDAIFS